MKLKKSVIGLMGCALISSSFCVDAGTSSQGFNWIGDSGYKVKGYFVYDNSLSIVGVDGGGSTGIDYLNVEFYSPGNSLLFSTVDVNNGIPDPDFPQLMFTYDTITSTVIGDLTNFAFSLGRNLQAGDLYVTGIIGGPSYLFDFNTNVLDTIADGTAFVPEPSSIMLFALGLTALVCRSRKIAH
ncbi:MAG: PEP-CTERM sorting domain-containing protein [Desulfuromonadaceae bacterium]